MEDDRVDGKVIWDDNAADEDVCCWEGGIELGGGGGLTTSTTGTIGKLPVWTGLCVVVE